MNTIQPKKTTYTVWIEVISGLAIGVCALAILSYVFADKAVPDPLPSATSTEYIKLCSGLDVTDETVQLIGTANCLGRLRGFVDGHQMTIKMQPTSSKMVKPMWCVDSSVTDKQVLDSVVNWSVDHPEDYRVLSTQLDSLNAATAIAIRALHETYPCKDPS